MTRHGPMRARFPPNSRPRVHRRAPSRRRRPARSTRYAVPARPPGLCALYPDLRETPEASPEQRTEWNVRDADALMVLVDARGVGCSAGTALALARAGSYGTPHIVIDLDEADVLSQAREFLSARAGGTVCIAGPRESEAPGLYAKARAFLSALLRGEGAERRRTPGV